MLSCRQSAKALRSIIGTSKTSNLQLKTTGYGYCKPDPVNGLDLPLFELQSRWWKRRLFRSSKLCSEIEADHLNQLLRPIFDTQDKQRAAIEERILVKGLPAGPGAATGRIVFHAEDAVEWKSNGEPVVLCRIETSPDDIRGMEAAQGILTARGGMTSHAALVARQMGKVCVAGCEALHIDYSGASDASKWNSSKGRRLDFG